MARLGSKVRPCPKVQSKRRYQNRAQRKNTCFACAKSQVQIPVMGKNKIEHKKNKKKLNSSQCIWLVHSSPGCVSFLSLWLMHGTEQWQPWVTQKRQAVIVLGLAGFQIQSSLAFCPIIFNSSHFSICPNVSYLGHRARGSVGRKVYGTWREGPVDICSDCNCCSESFSQPTPHRLSILHSSPAWPQQH